MNIQVEQANTIPKARITEPFVSVIVPVYNDVEHLQICLTALEQQTYKADRYEVIVVDNGSDPSENIAAIAATFNHAIATQELTPGSYAARNQGISVAKGEIIAFTDADCVPTPNWLEKGVSYLVNNPGCGLVAGKIDIFFKDPKQFTAIEFYDGVTMGFPQREFLEKRRAGATANVFTWKRVIDHVGGFKAQIKSHGDLEWGKRVFSSGYEQIYAEDACVGHPARYSFDELLSRAIRLAGGAYDLHIKQESSVWKRNKRFLKFIADDLIFHLGHSITETIQDQRLQPLDKKLKVIGLIILMKYISAFEKIRLKFGGKSRRS
ncbi:MAG: glycosyltransferase family 2 protein [Leptolyngbyaceae cyanobacterium SL_7_1]|nr:glycosyltransferase family 2 protein [Leptolyngbyaceae cyanobacterium SL_7_1]